MTDWTAGYVADIGYTYGYYAELNPLRIQLAFLHAGLVPPAVGTACELGFGQGLSTNIHAAASVVQWSGTDFNPAQASFAQELAAVSGSDSRLYDDAFADFCTRGDLPDFDFISLHGIWSWISDVNRAVIVDFVRRKLKVGGVLYISYNTQPGWAAMVPMRDLLTEHAEVMGADGSGIVQRIDNALTFADALFATNLAFARANPQVSERLKKLKDQNRNYLAHEYFNRDWLPMPFSKMRQWLSSAKVDYACSANLLDHIDNLNLTAEQQALLKTIPDAAFRQTVRDFMVNQQFRKDYWVKGARKLSALEQTERLRALRLVLTAPRADVNLKVTGGLGEATMGEAIYSPILDAMADHQVRTLAELEQAVSGRGISLGQLVQAMVVLSGAGHVTLAQDDQQIQAALPQAQALNTHLLGKARGGNDVSYLASPVTGAGVVVNRFQQLFLLAQAQGKTTPAEWAVLAWGFIGAQGQRLVKEGQTLESAQDNVAELTEQAHAFAAKQLPMLKALKVV